MRFAEVGPDSSPARAERQPSLVVWCDGAHDAIENMRRDAALLARQEVGGYNGVPILRLFRFDPPGITLGQGQRPERDLDLARCRADGVSWATRPTGGRAIFHAEEWTFSLCAAIDDPRWGGTLRQAYAAVSRLIAGSLARLGVPAQLAARRPAPPPRPDAIAFPASPPGCGPASAACFAATARHEIVLGDAKLVGAAQRRTASALLQQGSILLGDGHLRLIDYLAVPEERRAPMRAALRDAATNAGSFLGVDLRLERWADALLAELETNVRRVDGDEGAHLLTLVKGRSYTSSVSRETTRPGIAGRSPHA